MIKNQTMPNTSLAKILIVDDEPLFLRTTAALLQGEGYECVCAADGNVASAALAQQSFDLVLSDLNMPGNRQLEFLREGRGKCPHTPLIVVTGVPTLPTAIESIRLGITDYLLKPVKYEDLLASVRRALRSRRTAHPATPAPAMQPVLPFPKIVGESSPMRQVFDLMARVSESDANVLITGESGTGKEIIAGAIHLHSHRSDHAFQIVDCTAIPETLFESVLFGHAKGAFTGAIRDQVGLLSQADGGTVFLDEIGELPLAQQAKLLRVIQDPSFTPLGKTTLERVDTRFICATNRNLTLDVNASRFRRDLFYRLAVIHIELPPLRERGDDVILLARHFIQKLRRPNQSAEDFSEESQRLLRQYQWPGNVRELRNIVERGLTLARGNLIEPVDLPTFIHDLPSAEAANIATDLSTRDDAIRGAEHEYLVTLLRDNRGNVLRSARQAGISRQALHKLLKKHGVEAAEFRQQN